MKYRFFKYLCIFFEMGMIVFYIAGLFLMFSTFKYGETYGIVTEKGTHKTYLGLKNDYLVIDYNVKGNTYTYYKDTNLLNNKKVGDKVKVLYNRLDPNITRADYNMIIFFELGLFCLIMLSFCSYFKRKSYYEL